MISALLHGAVLLVLCRLALVPLAAPREAASTVAMLFVPSAPPTAVSPALPDRSPNTGTQVASAAPPMLDAAPASRAPTHMRTPSPTRHVVRHVAVPVVQIPAAVPAARPISEPATAPSPAIEAALPTPALSEPDAGSVARFTGLVQRAVQAAAAYPPVARRMAMQGRVQVRFDYAGGTVSDIAVAGRSEAPILDRAAMAAVRDAAYPAAPAPIGRRRLAMVVWVDFRLQPEG